MADGSYIQSKQLQGFILYNVDLDYNLMFWSGLVGKSGLTVLGTYKEDDFLLLNQVI